jgi:tetratricopeptide (TPR) repeat protein
MMRRPKQGSSFVPLMSALYDQRNYKEALEQARDAQTKDPQRWEAYAMCGKALFSMKRYRDAGDSLRTAASKAPQEQQAKLKDNATKADNEGQYQDLCLTAATQLSQGQYGAAAALLNSAWKLFPERTQTGFDAASNAILAKDYNTARSILQELAKVPSEAATADSMLTKLNLLTTLSSKQSEAASANPQPPPPLVPPESVDKEIGDLSKWYDEQKARPNFRQHQ